MRSATATASTHDALVRRLSRQSVTKHFDAYTDVDWDADDNRIDPADPRWELPDYSLIGSTAWYRSQPQETRARIGLHLITTFMKAGAQFENMLQRGLLEYALTLPNGCPEYRYAYHEIIEEGQHSLMFQEFVDRTGVDVGGVSAMLRVGGRWMARLGSLCPELLFVFAMGGEDPIDHVQRTYLRQERLHPLVRRIMQIHVTEEARHLSFARSYLKAHFRRLRALRRWAIQIAAPLLLWVMARPMTRVSREMVETYAIPADVLAEAYDRNPRHRTAVSEALQKTRQLCAEVGILTARTASLWRRLGLMEA
jgi:P-aminobenzoate N-oxygenase AurF